jgi:four helix bundle protein
MRIENYRDLIVWQKAMDLVDGVYALTRKLPEDERFGLCTQMIRAAVSIPANIAEGFGRMHRRAYANHCSISRGSVMELQTQLEVCVRQQFLKRDDIVVAWRTTEEVAKMLTTLIQKLHAPSTTKP